MATEKFGGNLNSAEKKLFILAQDRFEELSDTEYMLFRSIANSEPVDYGAITSENNDPNNASCWKENRTLRADRIRWLCIEPEIWKDSLRQRLDITGAKIEKSLNLSYTKVNISLRFSKCYFTEAILLKRAQLTTLELSGTHIASKKSTSIDAREIHVLGSVSLDNNFKAFKSVNLDNATIDGDLNCSKGCFTYTDGDALLAQSINVKGSVYLDDGFEAFRSVNLDDATIDGDLNCSKGHFIYKDGDALLARSINVKGSVHLDDEFKAFGKVNLQVIDHEFRVDLTTANSSH